jgi:hypothetical protein
MENTFYAVKYDTPEGLKSLRYFQNKEALKEYLSLFEILHDVKCVIDDEVAGSLYFAWTKKDGGILDYSKYRIKFPAYARQERFG